MIGQVKRKLNKRKAERNGMRGSGGRGRRVQRQGLGLTAAT